MYVDLKYVNCRIIKKYWIWILLVNGIIYNELCLIYKVLNKMYYYILIIFFLNKDIGCNLYG